VESAGTAISNAGCTDYVTLELTLDQVTCTLYPGDYIAFYSNKEPVVILGSAVNVSVVDGAIVIKP